jgi:hypothetical protein
VARKTMSQMRASLEESGVITPENHEWAISFVHSAVRRCLAALYSHTEPDGDIRLTKSQSEESLELSQLLWRTMARHVWRSVADIGLAHSLPERSLLAAADTLFAELSEGGRRHSERTSPLAPV